MNNTMREELTRRFTRLAKDDDVRVILVTGAGERAFSAGADIREFVEPLVPTTFRESRKRIDFRQVMDRCPQPIIAAIRGYAFGGGLELALACDIRIAADDAQLGLTEINLAIIPGGGGTQRLPRLVGRGKALEMILTGARISAAEALRIGLVERVVPAVDLAASAAISPARSPRRRPSRCATPRKRWSAGSPCPWPTASAWRVISPRCFAPPRTAWRARAPSSRSGSRAGAAGSSASARQ